MKPLSFILCLMIMVIIGGMPGYAQNPFTVKTEKQSEEPPQQPSFNNPLFAKIVEWQFRLRHKMTELTQEAKESGSLKPILPLLALTFLYGMLHAAGPGHGKFAALSYVVSSGRKYGKAVLFGNMIALFHAVSGIMLVLIVRMFLDKTVPSALEDASRIIGLISFSMIFLLGLLLTAKTIMTWNNEVDGTKVSDQQKIPVAAGPFAAALVIGMVPCPAVVLVMLFCMSIGLTGLGVVMAFTIASGMALTLTVVVLFGLTGKNIALKLTEQQQKASRIIERIIVLAASIGVALFGLLLFIANV